jgi:hypothetical protein
MGYRTLTCLALALAASAAPAAAQAVSENAPPPAEHPSQSVLSYDRALQNYTALNAGTRQLSDLSTVELQEVILLDRQIRAREPDTRSRHQKCLDAELDGLGSAPTALALRSIELKCSQR